ncbi:hypothetical protein AaE_010195, partial [Aphanomyces astaci]
AQLLAISYDSSAPRIQESDSAIDSICQSTLSNGYHDVVAPLLKAKRLVQQNKYADAYDMQVVGFVYVLFVNYMHLRDDSYGVVSIDQSRFTFDTRILAQHADAELSATRGIEVTDKLANAEQNLKKGFAMTLNDRAAPELSKKPATLYIVNQLFKIYFRLNKINLCGNVIQAINKQTFSIFDKRDQVTYMYYLGRIRMLEDKYTDADECFGFAWRHCHLECTRNKRMILQYLVPVKLALGVLPTPALLRQYQLTEYVDIAAAIRQGNLLAYYQVQHHDTNIYTYIYVVFISCLYILVL